MGESGFRTFFSGAGFWACSSPVWTKTKSQIVQTGVQTGGRKAMITVYPPDPLMPLGRNRPLTHTRHHTQPPPNNDAGGLLHTLPSGRFPPSALPDLRTFVSWERSRFRSLGVSTLARDLSVRPGMLTHEAHEKALRNAYTSRCTPRPKRLHQPRQDSDAHSSVHGNTPEDPSGSRQATIHPARTPRGRSSVPSLVAPRRTCGVLGSWNHAAH